MSERSLIGTSLKTLTTELNLMRINYIFYEKKVNASLIFEKGKKGIHTYTGKKPIRDLKLRQCCKERRFISFLIYYFHINQI